MEALRANTEFGSKVACVVFLHLDDTDAAHAIGGIEGTFIGQVIVVLESRQILEVSWDVHKGGKNTTCRKRLRADLDFNHMEFS